ncbi:hypothetical protein [Paucisalibacillus globulus]|uniref:hypothetical protein n=1 Tax=Paucisalibacillus globulus TaxID=351095 RepID=UPI000BB7333F|nr:hypothetical protein [Paucisalibacillus globulus]
MIARQIVDSEIWYKPPMYIKVWLYLLTKAQHTQYKGLKRGQLYTSIPEIIDACSWYVGFRKEKPEKDQIFRILNWMRKSHEQTNEKDTKSTMITTTKATHGLLITIDNYDLYQSPQSYESNGEGNNEGNKKVIGKQREHNNTNKNDDNDKKDNNDYINLIFNLYQSKKIIIHKRLTQSMKSEIIARLKEYSPKELMRVIENYSAVYFSDIHYFKHKYNLADLMKDEAVRKFIDESDPLNNFSKNSNKGNNYFKANQSEVVPDWFKNRKSANNLPEKTQEELDKEREEIAEILAEFKKN